MYTAQVQWKVLKTVATAYTFVIADYFLTVSESANAICGKCGVLYKLSLRAYFDPPFPDAYYEYEPSGCFRRRRARALLTQIASECHCEYVSWPV